MTMKKDEFSFNDDPEEGEFEEDVYSEKGREELEESDEIDEVEEGVALGFEEGSKMVYCSECGKLLVDDSIVEEEFNGEILRFCSRLCAMRYEEKQ